MATQLTETEVETYLARLDEWVYCDGTISKTFKFDAYQKGLVFASTVGFLADRMNHHPELTIGYQKVTVELSTHDVGGLSILDFELAARIDVLV